MKEVVTDTKMVTCCNTHDMKKRTMKMNELPKKIHDDKNGLDYTLCGDYYLPDLGVEPGYPLGKYDMVRMQYLKEQRPGLYTRLLPSGKLNDDLHQADRSKGVFLSFSNL